MQISVIVSTYNQPAHLDRVLFALGHQDTGNFDVIVADDGSGPQTTEIVEKHKDRWDYALHHVWHEDKGFRKTVILNKAIHASTCEYLVFLDGDCVPSSNFVRAHRLFAEQGHYIAGAYNRLPQKTTDRITEAVIASGRHINPLWLAINGYMPTRGFLRFYLPESIGRFLDRFGVAGHGRFPGGNSSCFRADALAVGGFNEAMTYGSEDREFGTRLCNHGIKPKRLKNATFVMHLEHQRAYADSEQSARNLEILRKTEAQGVQHTPLKTDSSKC